MTFHISFIIHHSSFTTYKEGLYGCGYTNSDPLPPPQQKAEQAPATSFQFQLASFPVVLEEQEGSEGERREQVGRRGIRRRDRRLECTAGGRLRRW